MSGRRAAAVACIAVVALAATGCGYDGTQPLTAEQVKKVDTGMGWEDVKAALGNTTQRTNGMWIWEPRSGPYTRVVVTLDASEEVATVTLTDR